MDLNALLNSIATGDWKMALLGAALSIIAQRLGIKLPFAPKPAPTPGPSPTPGPAPAPTGRPVLDALLALIRGGAPAAAAAVPVASASPAELVAARRAIDAHLGELRAALAPEPARPAP